MYRKPDEALVDSTAYVALTTTSIVAHPSALLYFYVAKLGKWTAAVL